MNETRALERRYFQAVQAMREAQQHKCEAVWEFVQAREALLRPGPEATLPEHEDGGLRTDAGVPDFSVPLAARKERVLP